MKILHVIANLFPEKGGPPKAATNICQALAKKGHDVTLYTLDDGTSNVPYNQPINNNGYSIVYFPLGKPRAWSFSLPLARSLKDHLKGFDLVHIHSVYLFHTFITSFYCRKYQIPYLIKPHGTFDPFIRRKSTVKKRIYHFLIERRNLNNAAAIHYTAVDEMEKAHAALRIKSSGLVIPLGLNLDEFGDLPQYGLFRQSHPHLRDKLVLLFLGRITPVKGLNLLIEAFQRVRAIHPSLHLLIVGPEDPGYGVLVHEWVKTYGIEDQVTFTGMLTGKEKLSAFVDSDLFVLPSYSENFGLAILEAMACNVPVITTNHVNIWRDIAASEAGEIIDCEVSALEGALTKLILDPELRHRYAANGRKLVEQKYDWDTVVDELIRAYQNITSGREYHSKSSLIEELHAEDEGRRFWLE